MRRSLRTRLHYLWTSFWKALLELEDRIPRGVTLISVSIAWVAAIFMLDALLSDSRVFYRLWQPNIENGNVAAARIWNSLFYMVVFICGIPATFLLWMWRNRDQVAKLEEERKQTKHQGTDVTTKESDSSFSNFNMVSAHAMGMFDPALNMSNPQKEMAQSNALIHLSAKLRDAGADSIKEVAIQILVGVPEPSNAPKLARLACEVRDKFSATGDHASRGNVSEMTWLAGARLAIERAALTRLKVIRDRRDVIFPWLGLNGSTGNFDFADLHDQEFHANTQLYASSFIGANLRGASFHHSCVLSGSNFTAAQFSHLMLRGNQLVNTILVGVSAHALTIILEDGDYVTGLNMDRCEIGTLVIRGPEQGLATLKGWMARNARIKALKIDCTDINSLDLSEFDLSFADIDTCEINRTRLFAGKATYLKVAKLSITQGKLENIDLSKSVLEKATFLGDSLRSVSFVGSELRGAQFGNFSVIAELDLTEADLTGLNSDEPTTLALSENQLRDGGHKWSQCKFDINTEFLSRWPKDEAAREEWRNEMVSAGATRVSSAKGPSRANDRNM